MAKYDFKVDAIGTNGKPQVPAVKLCEIFAQLLGTETESSVKTLKMYDWMKKLQVGDPLELDDTDKADLINYIEQSKRLMVYIKGQLLDILNKPAKK